LIGGQAPLALRATFRKNGAIALDNLSLELASGTLTGDAMLAGPDRAVVAHLQARLPRLALIGDALGMAVTGSAELIAAISGTEDRPRIAVDATGENIAVASSGAEHAEAHLMLTPSGILRDPASRIDIAARGMVRGVTSPDADFLAAAVNRDLNWSMAAKAAPDGSAIELSEISAHGVGVDLAGSGVFDQARTTLDGRIRLSVDDLRLFAGLAGRPRGGALLFDVTAQQREADRIAVQVDGSIVRLRTGIPAIDALGSDRVAIAGSGRRNPAGVLKVERLTLSGAGSTFEASGDFDPATRQIAATLDAEIRQLQPLGVALDAKLAGRLTAHVNAEGPLDHVRGRAQIDGVDIASLIGHPRIAKR
jgi:translocation and assembly module TamB